MPEYLAPGVYVEETSFRPKSIEGVGTSTAGFVGPARYGPIGGEPELLTSFADFERIYAGLEPLTFASGLNPPHNYLAHAVRAFFEEGGRRCYVARVYAAAESAVPPEFIDSFPGSLPDSLPEALADDVGAGHAAFFLGAERGTLGFVARFPGEAGNFRVTFTARLSDDLVTLDRVADPANPPVVVQRIQSLDTVYVSPGAGATFGGGFYDVVQDGEDLLLQQGAATIDPAGLRAGTDGVRMLTVDVMVERPIHRPQRPSERYELFEVLDGFTLHPEDVRSLEQHYTRTPRGRRLALSVPFALTYTPSAGETITGARYAEALFGAALPLPPAPSEERQFVLTGGSDGLLPSADAYRGEDGDPNPKSGFTALEDVDDIAIVAAPGYSYGYVSGTATEQADILTKQAHLINHATRMRYRIAVLDAPNNAALSEVREFRGKIDSKYAALYYPWVRIVDPVSRLEASMPPSGFVAGIYARNDVERGVQKAPANEVVRLAIGFEFSINTAQQDVLNPENINCFRFFEGRGYRLWGARTATSDNEFKYVNVRRYLAYLERSIDLGTQVFVFDSNGHRLWDNVRRTVEDFLYAEWRGGRLMGLTPEEAYFVKCDRSTMSQNDIDNGRLICLIGVSLLKPAEFVIFRIGQKLLDQRG